MQDFNQMFEEGKMKQEPDAFSSAGEQNDNKHTKIVKSQVRSLRILDRMIWGSRGVVVQKILGSVCTSVLRAAVGDRNFLCLEILGKLTCIAGMHTLLHMINYS